MFLGEFSHNLDDKGRLTIPAKFRDELAGGLVITRGLDRCLFVFPRQGWDNLAQKIAALPLTQRNARNFSRLMFSGAADFIPDRQGRVLIPQGLRDYAKQRPLNFAGSNIISAFSKISRAIRSFMSCSSSRIWPRK